MKEIIITQGEIEYIFSYAYQLIQQEAKYTTKSENNPNPFMAKMEYDLAQRYHNIQLGVEDVIKIIGLELDFMDFLKSKYNNQ